MELLTEYSAYQIPVKDIWLEPMFNCRESIALTTVDDLAKAIALRGLQFPVTVQPREDCNIPEGYAFRLIVGFRRFTACTRLLKWDTIPAIVRRGLADNDARILNLTENIDRKDLNILEEARALKMIFPEGTTIANMATTIRRNPRWCSIRVKLLKMAPEIQEAAANRLVTEGDIQIIASVAPDCQFSVFKRILEQRATGQRPAYKRALKKDPRPPAEDVQDRMRTLVYHGLGGFVGRLLLWAAGEEITDEQIDREIESVLAKYEQTGTLSGEDLLGIDS
jgi:ParB family transcriptional regulator, chromosome partitioning protein